MAAADAGGSGTFWDHFDVLRGVVLRALGVTLLFAVAAFCMKEWLFAAVLAPQSPDFPTYRLLGRLAGEAAGPAAGARIINTGLATQFMTHLSVSFYAGLLAASPYVVYSLFAFVRPALYPSERRRGRRVALAGYLMFMAGLALAYLLVFPLTYRFLSAYQVRGDIENLISLRSYIDTFMLLCLAMGVMFELPVVCWLLAKAGVISPRGMRRYRRHAIVAILVAAAVITPTADVFTLLVVSLPIYLLYEASIALCRRARPRERRNNPKPIAST